MLSTHSTTELHPQPNTVSMLGIKRNCHSGSRELFAVHKELPTDQGRSSSNRASSLQGQVSIACPDHGEHVQSICSWHLLYQALSNFSLP
jgi:hypothetical protein